MFVFFPPSGGVQILQPSVRAEQGERASLRPAALAATHGSGGSYRIRDSERGVPGHQVGHTHEAERRAVISYHSDM